MNSLRTDDILGAKPRVRHMPKNMITQRIYPGAYLSSLRNSNPQHDQFSQSRQYQQLAAKEDHIQYQNNDINSYPFYSRNQLSKESRYVSYDFPKEMIDYRRQLNNSSYINQPNSRQHMTRVASEDKYRNIEVPEQRLDAKIENNIQPTLSKQSNDRMAQNHQQSKSRSSSRRSVDNKQAREESKRIFRGLGFNIISNHKFQYLFQHAKPKIQ